MAELSSLKAKLRRGEPVRFTGAPMDASRSQLEDAFRGGFDLVTVDAQHSAFDEQGLVNFCAASNDLGVPVRLRIEHTLDAYLISHYLDLGPLSIIVPQVETEAAVDEAIAAFYYTPIGKRSSGARYGIGFRPDCNRREYADWWNANGVLCIQLESVDAIVNVRKLAKPGVDMVVFGANDLSFSLETYPDPPFGSVQECVREVRRQMAGTQVHVGAFGLGPEHMDALTQAL